MLVIGGAVEGAEFGVDEKPVEHAVAAGAFAGLGRGELLLNLFSIVACGVGSGPSAGVKSASPSGVGWLCGFAHGARDCGGASS